MATNASLYILNDKEVLETAQTFLNETLNDGTVQEAAGELTLFFFSLIFFFAHCVKVTRFGKH